MISVKKLFKIFITINYEIINLTLGIEPRYSTNNYLI